jgi:RsiW-degrading membrane proteinase PrsW (M82 family)
MPAADETPGWVVGVALLGTIVTLWAFMVGNSLTEESSPEDSFFTSFFADKK